VQLAIPARAKRMLGSAAVTAYHREDAEKVLTPIRRFLDRHAVPHRCASAASSSAVEIVRAVRREHGQMIVMGTHGMRDEIGEKGFGCHLADPLS
jgi:nucleotide-binding universal stress UspA family protein